MNLNKWLGIGKVNGAPRISGEGASKRADLTFTVIKRRKDANGEWVDSPIHIPVYAFGQKADVVERWVVDGQELTIEGEISAGDWGWGVIVINIELGFKPRNTANGGGAASSPPSGPPM